jgi:hypothetical protein
VGPTLYETGGQTLYETVSAWHFEIVVLVVCSTHSTGRMELLKIIVTALY